MNEQFYKDAIAIVDGLTSEQIKQGLAEHGIAVAPVSNPMGQELPPRPAVQLNGIGFYSAKQIGELIAPYADRIHHLERENGLLEIVCEQQKARIASADARIADLERELKQAKLQQLADIGQEIERGPVPVAWAVTAERGGIHKLSITRESAERKAAVWREEWPNNGCKVRPLVFGDAAAPTPTSTGREEAK